MTDENKNTIKINGKAIAVIVILLLLLVGTFGMFILGSSDSNMGSVAQAGGASGDMPEKFMERTFGASLRDAGLLEIF